MTLPIIMMGCNKDDDTNEITLDSIEGYYKSQKVYYNGTYYIPYITDKYAYKFSETGEIIWKNKIQYPPVTVTESHGESINLEYRSIPDIALFKDNYALYFAPSTLITNAFTRYTFLDICSSDGNLIKRIKYEDDVTIHSWSNDIILVDKGEYAGCWMSKDGNETSFQYKNELFFLEEYIPIDTIGYVTYSASKFAIINFEKGNDSNILEKFVTEQYGNISYKINIANVDTIGVDVLVEFDIVTKDSKTIHFALKINTTAFSYEII